MCGALRCNRTFHHECVAKIGRVSTPSAWGRVFTDAVHNCLNDSHCRQPDCVCDGSDIPVTILCGFLGSGKTTLLTHVLNNKDGLNVGVLVNDMATVNVDSALIAKNQNQSDNQQVVELQNGCVCCELQGDMVQEVKKMASRTPPVDVIIVEASGIAQPQRMIKAFVDSSPGDVDAEATLPRLDTAVTVVDAQRFAKDMTSWDGVGDREAWVTAERARKSDGTKVAQLLTEQVETADVIVVNKTDLVSEQERDRVIGTCRAFNPSARLILSSFGRVSLSQVLNTGLFGQTATADVADQTVSAALDTIGSFVYSASVPFHPERLHALVRGWRSDRIVRSKGHVTVAQPLSDSNKASPPPPLVYYWTLAGRLLGLQEPSIDWEGGQEGSDGASPPSEVVIIGYDLNQAAITALLDRCLLTDAEQAALQGKDDPATPMFTNPIVPVKDPATTFQEAEFHVRSRWFRIALLLATFTIVWNVAEGVVSIVLGAEHESISLIGFGADAIVEVFSASLVLYRLLSDPAQRPGLQQLSPEVMRQRKRLELRTVVMIACLLVFLGLGTMAGSALTLSAREEPEDTMSGVVISLVSLSWMMGLYVSKVTASVVLQSDMLAADASCSLACFVLSLVLFSGSLAFEIDSRLWWVDSVTAIVIALFFLHDGARALYRASRAESADEVCCNGGTLDAALYMRLRRALYTSAGVLRVDVELCEDGVTQSMPHQPSQEGRSVVGVDVDVDVEEAGAGAVVEQVDVDQWQDEWAVKQAEAEAKAKAEEEAAAARKGSDAEKPAQKKKGSSG